MKQSSQVRRALQIAQAKARENKHEQYTPVHLLWALVHQEVGITVNIASLCDSGMESIYDIRLWSEMRMRKLISSSKITRQPWPNPAAELCIQEAENISLEYMEEEIGAMVLLAAVCSSGIGFTQEQLFSLPINRQLILQDKPNDGEELKETVKSNLKNDLTQKNEAGYNSLQKYCTDLCELAKAGDIRPVFGRDSELRRMQEILGRMTKPNVLLLGAPGVGKSALIGGLALYITGETCPEEQKGANLFELNLGALLAGASYMGEKEDRLKQIIVELKALPKAILFIDELHALLDSKDPMMAGLGNLLKPELARGAFKVIGASTPEEFTLHLEKDKAFCRRFETLLVEEPSLEKTKWMLNALLPKYQERYKLEVPVKVLTTAIDLASGYLKERKLPDSAIDLLEGSMTSVRHMLDTSFSKLSHIQNRLKTLIEEEHSLNIQQETVEIYTAIEALSPSLLRGQELPAYPDSFENILGFNRNLLQFVNDLSLNLDIEKKSLEPEDIYACVSQRTQIPVGELQKAEQEKLLNLSVYLSKKVIGQDHALKVISEAICESRAGLGETNQPIGSFFLLGSTGTGKTELAKALAASLFGDESALIRFDMSEFMQDYQVSALNGAAPGLEGSPEGGRLVNAIRNRPYSVLLFDEIEKAHPSISNLFLQLLDEGKLTDSLGREGDFSNAVVLFTSNAGSKQLLHGDKKPEDIPHTDLMEILSRHYRPEFLNRIGDIVAFNPISEPIARKILDAQLKKLQELLKKQEISLSISSDAKTWLLEKGFSRDFGARPLKRVLRDHVRRPLSVKILSGELPKESHISLNVSAGKLILEPKTLAHSTT